MKINTITCHNVYNHGASLQAYALSHYLSSLGHEVEIIDYMPKYLRPYAFSAVNNPRFDRPIVRTAYCVAKLPFRVCERRFSRRRRSFNAFTKEFLPTTKKRYHALEELKKTPPVADLYIAGSDQIWNPVFKNGKDGAFFLDFVPTGKKRASYAASFAVDEVSETDKAFMKPLLSRFDKISVREESGVNILSDMGISGVRVLDPVFLLPKEHWKELAIAPIEKKYLLVYDFDSSPEVSATAKRLASERSLKIYSMFPLDGADKVCSGYGPREFLGALINADCVISSSFHATAFSIMFGIDFYVFNRKEKINTRMADMLARYGMTERLISSPDGLTDSPVIFPEALESDIIKSKEFLNF